MNAATRNRTGIFRAVVAAAALCALLTIAPRARAAGDSEAGAAAAESLFQDGRKLMEAKRYAEACSKFAASHKVAPALGTLLNLADCYEKNNQLASAWARFHEAIALAQRLNRPNREQTARDRANRLEPRLVKLTIFSRSSAVDVKLDGNPVDRGALGTPIPVDPGKHTIEATANGKKPFSTTIDVTEKVKAPTIEIPVLEDVARAGDGVVTAEPPDTPVTPPPREAPKSNWSGRKTIAVIVGGLGVVGLGVGSYYGLKARSTWRDALSYCSVDYECEEAGVDLAATAKRFGNYATYGFIAGGALLAGGAVLFLTAPSPKKTTGAGVQRIGVGPGSIVLGGTF